MAEITVALERALARRATHGGPGLLTGRVLARGDGWTVEDVICTSGPEDRPFEEQHAHVSIGIVVVGTFQYRSTAGCELMAPGALLLGNPGQWFECGHEHAAGDRCIAFRYAPDYFERLAADAGACGASAAFGSLRLPPVRGLSRLVARACAGLVEAEAAAWEELSVELAARAIQLAGGLRPYRNGAPPGVVARVTQAVRTIEHNPGARLALGNLARDAGLSPYHFLRTFQRLTGVTPHQYVLRTRLREAALRLAVEPAKVIDIAFDCGFGDVSNFNRAFRSEFGVSPRAYRITAGLPADSKPAGFSAPH